ncbi:hypothetical protein CAEBREN_00975 [Caenorhabditis brenneri]|uniref:Uncharacterized protein n=1 Tax=Caenorhabditis brenneri TaxID=135651 RepID=G0MQP0_CAEBE|nr:hypothetical protein CAEBREN_00975 [Caenorhabditis brenneri]
MSKKSCQQSEMSSTAMEKCNQSMEASPLAEPTVVFFNANAVGDEIRNTNEELSVSIDEWKKKSDEKDKIIEAQAAEVSDLKNKTARLEVQLKKSERRRTELKAQLKEFRTQTKELIESLKQNESDCEMTEIIGNIPEAEPMEHHKAKFDTHQEETCDCGLDAKMTEAQALIVKAEAKISSLEEILTESQSKISTLQSQVLNKEDLEFQIKCLREQMERDNEKYQEDRATWMRQMETQAKRFQASGFPLKPETRDVEVQMKTDAKMKEKTQEQNDIIQAQQPLTQSETDAQRVANQAQSGPIQAQEVTAQAQEPSTSAQVALTPTHAKDTERKRRGSGTETEEQPKRKRGRPIGSTNKKTRSRRF